MSYGNLPSQQNQAGIDNFLNKSIFQDNNSSKISSLINDLLKSYDENFFTTLRRIPNQSLYVYALIVIAFLFLAQWIEISFTTVILIITAVIIIIIIYSNEKITSVAAKEENKIKLEFIKPKPKRMIDYPDLVNFFYSIKQFYYINPNAFYAVVNNVEQFLGIYEAMMNNEIIYCKQMFEVANQFYRNALNHLHSLIFNMNVDKYITNKFQRSIKDLNVLLYQYVERLIHKCNTEFKSHNINNNSGFIQQFGPKPVNYYDEMNTEYTASEYQFAQY